MNIRWFVFIYSDKNTLYPLTNNDSDSIALFSSVKDALKAARKNFYAKENGFYLFCINEEERIW